MFSPHILLCLLAQWNFPSVVFHWVVAYYIYIIFPHQVGEAEGIRQLVVNALNTTLSALWFTWCTTHAVLYLAMSYDACVQLPTFPALKVWYLAVMASSASLFHHQVSHHDRWGLVVPHISCCLKQTCLVGSNNFQGNLLK